MERETEVERDREREDEPKGAWSPGRLNSRGRRPTLPSAPLHSAPPPPPPPAWAPSGRGVACAGSHPVSFLPVTQYTTPSRNCRFLPRKCRKPGESSKKSSGISGHEAGAGRQAGRRNPRAAAGPGDTASTKTLFLQPNM